MIQYPSQAPIVKPVVNLQRYQAGAIPRDEDPNLRELLGAAFAQENDVVNMLAMINQPNFDPDPNFDFEEAAKSSRLFKINPKSFVGVASQAEWNFVSRKMLKEMEDRRVLTSAGWEGMFAAMLAGTLSPTVLLPVGLGARAATVGGAALSGAAWGGIGVGAQEAVLQANQELRTPLESAVGIGAGMILAGALSGSARWVLPDELVNLRRDMATGQLGEAISKTHAGVPDPAIIAQVYGEDAAKIIQREAIPLDDLDDETAKLLEAALGNVEDAQTFTVWRGGEDGKWYTSSETAAQKYAADRGSERVVSKQIKFKNPLIIDAKGANWNNIGGTPMFDVRKADGTFAGYAKETNNVEELFGPGAKIVGRTEQGGKPSVFDDGRSTDDIVQEALLNDAYDGVIIKNVSDNADGGVEKGLSDVYYDIKGKTVEAPKAAAVAGQTLVLSPFERAVQAIKEAGGGFPAPGVTRLREELEGTTLRGAALNSKINKLVREHLETYGTGPQSLGASIAERPPLPDPGLPVAMRTRLGRALFGAWMSPQTRNTVKDWESMRATVWQLSPAGLMSESELNFNPSALGGAVEARIWQHQARVVEGIQATNQEFYNFYKRTKGAGGLRSIAAVSAKEQFMFDVTDAMHLKLRGRSHSVPEVNKAAEAYLNKVFYPMIKEAKELGLPAFRELSEPELLTIATQHIKHDKVISEPLALHSIARQHAYYKIMNDPELLQNKKLIKMLEESVEVTGSRIVSAMDLSEAIAAKLMARWGGVFNKHGSASLLTEVPLMAKFAYIDPTMKFKVKDVAGKEVERTFGEFLEKNMEKTARSWVRSMGPDIEMYRTFGVVNPMEISGRHGEVKAAQFWVDIEKEQQAKLKAIAEDADKRIAKKAETASPEELARFTEKVQAQVEKANTKIGQDVANFKIDMEAMIGRLRHTWGQPKDPTNPWFRTARAVMNLNTVRLMGMVTISSFADIARLVMKHGFMTTMRDGLIPLLTDLRTIKMSAEEGMYSGAILDLVMHGRSNAWADLFDETEFGTLAERGLQQMTNKIGMVALFDYWNTGLKSMSSALTIADMSRALKAVDAGTATAKQKRFLAKLGLDEDLSKRMWKKITTDGGEEVRPGVWLPNTGDWDKIKINDQWEDLIDFETYEYKPWVTDEMKAQVREGQDLQRVYRAALGRNINDTIVTPGIERPLWTDATTSGRLIAQFRSFGLSSHYKTLTAAAQEVAVGNMAPIITGTSFSLALGIVSYYAWAATFGTDSPQFKKAQDAIDAALRGEFEDGWDKLFDEAIARSGLLGAFEELRKTAERVPAIQDYATFADTPTTRSPFVNPFSEAFGPTYGSLLETGNRLMLGVGDWGDSESHTLRKLFPYQNVLYLRWVYDQIEKHARNQL